MVENLTQQEKLQRGAQDAGAYFRNMTQFVGFTPQDAGAIREAALVVEKYLPQIVTDFYTNLLRYPQTRKHFYRKDGTLDQDYLQKRMHHLTNFWRRTCSGEYDDDYARYVDYVGRAHTSHGADPNIYIEERYVIGQVGFIQHAISQALYNELHEVDPDLETRAVQAWNKLMMVILETLARAYAPEVEPEATTGLKIVDREALERLAVHTYEAGLGLVRDHSVREVRVASEAEIPEGERKLVDVDGLSIGVFHHQGEWYAVHNHCLHRGGPVASGPLEGDVLVCPWHGYRYNLKNGCLLDDPSVKLDMYNVTLREGDIYLTLAASREAAEALPDTLLVDPIDSSEEPERNAAVSETVSAEYSAAETNVPAHDRPLGLNEFLVDSLHQGQIKAVQCNGESVAVFNVGGMFYATQEACTHAGGPLSLGDLRDSTVECPIHGACFNVTNGEVLQGPADQPLKTYKVVVEGGVGRVESA
jgi:nitrite reductase/ring-hydroxylating ferredoxin subunit